MAHPLDIDLEQLFPGLLDTLDRIGHQEEVRIRRERLAKFDLPQPKNPPTTSKSTHALRRKP